MEELPQRFIDANVIKPNNIFYPGKMRKFGTSLGGEQYIVKIAESPLERLRLYAEWTGGLLCRQLSIKTSEIRLFAYQDSLALLSKSWLDKEVAQFFSLASYYESLIDTFGKEVKYSYSFFQQIVKKYCPESYNHILGVFWRVFIIDYLLINIRHAGNWGFIDDGTVHLAPIYDCSTRLQGMEDDSWRHLQFPSLKMQFDKGRHSAYDILTHFEDIYKDEALKDVKTNLKVNHLQGITSEELFLKQVISFRFQMLF